ncbi:MAG: DUF72 domain-containing protein [Bauldia sp.]|nr:DUF72 domain-containing protein [Bauldia sp.]
MIRVGIGGWDFDEWRGGAFYPAGLAKSDALRYASRRLTSIEINATFYKSQGAESFRRWREETPENFVFAVKGHRAVTAKAKLAESAEAIRFFFDSGVLELKEKLGPILWQMPHNKKFNAEDFAAFLKLLPPEANGRPLMHVLEPRHETFVTPEFVELAAKARMPIVYADSDDYPAIADLTGDFIYARLQRSREEEKAGYTPRDLDQWALCSKVWAEGGSPRMLRYVGEATRGDKPRDVYVYFIAGAKLRNPRAAMALIERLGPENRAAGGYEELASSKSASATRTSKRTSAGAAKSKTKAKPAARAARPASSKAKPGTARSSVKARTTAKAKTAASKAGGKKATGAAKRASTARKPG